MPSKQRLRTMCRTTYDVQDFRTRVGGRIVQNFRAKLGLDDGQPDDEDEVDVLREIEARYKRVTDGIALDDLSRRRTYAYDGVITEYGELTMINHYLRLCETERVMFRDLGHEIEKWDIWTEFFDDVKGVGPAMASVMISEFDPRKGKYVSSFWRHAGLGTMTRWYLVEKSGEELDDPEPIMSGDPRTSDTPPSEADFHEDGETATLNGKTWKRITKAQSRRREHLVEREYEDSDGNTQTKRGLSFNPFLHDKLLGVLGPCLLRAGGEYKDVYDDYRHRIKNEGKGQSDGHRHRMGIRYAVKELVRDLYINWRPLVNLPVHDGYAEEKLGHEHEDAGEDRHGS